MVLSDSRDTVVAKINLIHLSYQLMCFNFYHTNAIFIDPALIPSNTVCPNPPKI